MTLLTLKTTKRDKETMQGEIVELTANSDRPSVPSPWKEVDGHCIASKGCCRNSYGLPRCVSVGKKAPSNVGDTGDAGSIPGLGRYPEKEKATHSCILSWKIPRTEEPGGLQSMGSESDTPQRLRQHYLWKGTRLPMQEIWV